MPGAVNGEQAGEIKSWRVDENIRFQSRMAEIPSGRFYAGEYRK